MFGLQPTHLLIILAVALLLLGPSWLPELGRSLGATIKEFRAATKEPAPNVEKEKAESNNS